MYRPQPHEFVVPLELGCAAAETYVNQAADSMTFTEFYELHELDKPESYPQFRDPADIAVEKGLVGPEDTVQDALDYLRVEAALRYLLRSADEDAGQAYAFSRILLKDEGFTDPHILPFMQKSKRLGRVLGASRSSGIASIFTIGYSHYKVHGQELLTIERDEHNVPTELALPSEVYEEFVRPFLSQGESCPMLGRTAAMPQTQKIVNFFDLFWEASLARAHAEFERRGML